jgi:hypothetical protein
MERLFSPCSRLHDSFGSPLEGLQDLNLDVSTEELLSAERAFTYTDLYAMLGNEDTAAWLTQHAAITRDDGRVVRSWFSMNGSCYYRLIADGNVLVAWARSPEHLLETCDVVIRLLAASVVHSVTLDQWGSHTALIDAASLAYLMERCQSLKALTLHASPLDANQCRVLGAYSRPDLEIVLDRCHLTSAGASALAEVLGRNQGPTKLDRCDVDNIVLADGLRGNSRLKNFRPGSSHDPEVTNQQALAIAGALRENKGLVDFNLRHYSVSDETWNALCDSLKTHPTLEVLNLRVNSTDGTTTPAVITSRIQSLLDMMKVNMLIHTIHLPDRYIEDELFRESVIPYLLTNMLRPRLLAIQKIRSIAYRAKVLGRALLSARTDPNSFCMLLSGNPEITFSPTTATIAVVAGAATAAATSTTANVRLHLSLDRTSASSS